MTTYAVTDPYTGHRDATYESATDAEVEAAVAAADRAYRTWSRHAPPEERASRLIEVARLLRERAGEFGSLQRRETGRPTDWGVGEAAGGAELAEFFAAHAADLAADMPIPAAGPGTAVVRRAPLGALLCITPWNAPIFLVMRVVAANLAVGNTVILKPDPHCPATAEALQRVFDDAGLDGAVVTVRATNEQVATMLADPRVVGVSFTGSVRAGSAVAEIAGRSLKRVSLELGGSDPFIVLSTRDLDEVVEIAYSTRMMLGSQACCAAKRFVVVDDLYDDFVSRLVSRMRSAKVGPPEIEGCDIGPLSSIEAAERVEGQVRGAVAQGATLLAGGQRERAMVSPGVLADVTRDMDAYGAEIFGPIAMVHRVADEAEAIAVANDTPYGLGSYVFTTDPAQASRVADALDVGMVRINSTLVKGPTYPFGGVKASGTGRPEGLMATDEFVNMKLIHTGPRERRPT